MTPNFKAFLAVLAGAALIGSCSAVRAADRHPCRGIATDLAQVYDKFVGAKEGEDLGAYAQLISANDALPKETRRFLVSGLMFLVDYYQRSAGKSPERAAFVRGGAKFCTEQFGAVADRGSV